MARRGSCEREEEEDGQRGKRGGEEGDPGEVANMGESKEIFARRGDELEMAKSRPRRQAVGGVSLL